MRRFGKSFWRSVPFIRLLIPLTAGILIGFYYTSSLLFIFSVCTVAILFLLFFRALPAAKKYAARWLNGIFTNLLIAGIGILLVYTHDISNQKNWIGNYIGSHNTVLATLQEPLTEKEHSYKAIVKATAVWIDNKWKPVTGNLLVYFSKDSISGHLHYGSQIVFNTSIRNITNSGNPGAFDYQQYAAFQDIHHQVFLRPGDYRLIDKDDGNAFTKGLFTAQKNILSTLTKYIPGRKESGVAEALLIGYRTDLDKDLVRSYSNTGVVHIIAISGLHLGMIYGLLVLLLKPLRKLKAHRWLHPLIILSVLWGFSLLTGAAASILRSAVMFSFIVIGESIGRKSNIYNTLAASAFCLLVYNPYFLWDVGFQLSYGAVTSIVLFMKPIYRSFYIKNKLLDNIWQLNAVTLSAQVLTLPMLLFYFHQFPNLFLFTNFVAVPVSGFILYGELLLLIVAKVPVLVQFTGKTVSFMIAQMNGYIERTGSLPFSVTDNIQINLLQAIFLYIFLSAGAWWLLQRKTKGFIVSLLFLTAFALIRCTTLVRTNLRQKLIVYNIPKHAALDVIEGSSFQYIGDSIPAKGTLQSFYLHPARTQLGAYTNGRISHTFISKDLVASVHTTVLIIKKWGSPIPPKQKIPVNVIILSGNPKVYISELASLFNCTQYVFDNSNPLWKIRFWKKEADSLHLRHHATSEQGAFEVAL